MGLRPHACALRAGGAPLKCLLFFPVQPVQLNSSELKLHSVFFLRTLANKLSTKNDEPYASVISWLRIQLSFAILRTVHRCVRGSRYLFKSREVSEDFTLAVAGLHLYS